MCGPIKEWNRLEVNGRPKSFGFCTFLHPEGALRARRMLDGSEVADQKIKVLSLFAHGSLMTR